MRGAAAWSTTVDPGIAGPGWSISGLALVALWLLAAPCLAAECSPHVTERPASGEATFRPHTTAFEACEVAEDAYRQVVANWLRERPTDAPPLTGLSLGRAVSFPWIARHIADSALGSPGWDARGGKARGVGINNLVSGLLSEPAFLRRLGAPFEGSGYAIAGVRVEKVLVGKASEFTSSENSKNLRVPFDAQVWIHLSRR
ncbi:MAG TPA: hypothetical protein VF859_07415 [Burkholderiales bacterium]